MYFLEPRPHEFPANLSLQFREDPQLIKFYLRPTNMDNSEA